MLKPKILTGYELVEKGFTKIDSTLPEVGLKFVQPNGTWLEQKQIQSALDARKHLIEVERIEKSGTLSIAVWKEDLMLAEVTQKVGGYWQHMGHNNGSQLLLYPEEALFLMEVNCLQLIHNDMKVSLQQAYSLLLRDKITLLQYKVYASLSRLGYRLFRHKKSVLTNYEKKINFPKSKKRCNNFPCTIKRNFCSEDNTTQVKIEHIEILDDEHEKYDLVNNNTVSGFNGGAQTYKCTKLQKLKYRKVKPCSGIILKYFDCMPELLGNNPVTLNAPNKEYIPSSIHLKKAVYHLNINNLSNKTVPSTSVETNLYNADEEVNGSHVRRINSLPRNTRPCNNWIPPSPHIRFGNQSNHPQFNMPQYQPFIYFNRPRSNFFYNFNMLYQRPYLPQWHNAQQFRFSYNQFNAGNSYNMNVTNDNSNQNNLSNQQQHVSKKSRKRKRYTAKKRHLDGIKKLAIRLKQLFTSGILSNENHQSLLSLISTYNRTYKANIRLNNDFDIMSDERVLESIVLDDSTETSNKKRRISNHDETFEDNLKMLKQLALQLKNLEKNRKATPRHRRAISKALKAFNQCFKVEYYINDAYEIINSRYIDLDSSSDSSCVIEEEIHKENKSKKLKNPFNILKRLSEKQNEAQSDASSSSSQMIVIAKDKYSELIIKTFTKEWLPKETDFGCAEVVNNGNIVDTSQEEFLFEFHKMQPDRHNNWLNLKLSFYSSLKEAMVEFRNVPASVNREINSIVKPNDCTDMHSVLNKLRIINTETNINEECRLEIDFDVYNKNVQNFRKTDPPKPHFRIVCLKETSDVPSGDEVATLNAVYNDNVSVVFAVVGQSISYLQIKPTNLPVYVSNNN